MNTNFETLSPLEFLDSLEENIGLELTSFVATLPSYINRVYEIQAVSSEKFVVKFYRPGRWSEQTIRDEHRFVLECANEEIPVVAPIELANGDTIGNYDGILFVVYPKRLGRRYEIKSDDDWERIGSLLGRIHMVGMREVADNRLFLTPNDIIVAAQDKLLKGNFITSSYQQKFSELMDNILHLISDRFEDVEVGRIHGDCHFANIMDRLDDGLAIIDFDDMMNGPAVQDMWLLLPDYLSNSLDEFYSLLAGYEQFVDFDYSTMGLIEPLRILRMIYFLGWCAEQANDLSFQRNFPNWGNDHFWANEINDFERQINMIKLFDERQNPLYN
jgi:Ser/Thr protein kinase RdoA (MazF antagonist)